MTASQRPSARWPQYLLLACILVLAITIPISWHRQHKQRTQTGPVVAQSSPVAQLPSAADREIVETPEITEAELSLPELEPVCPSPAPLASSPFASLIVDNTADILPRVEPPLSESAGVHRFRREAWQLDEAPVFWARALPLPEALNERLAMLQDHPQADAWSKRVQGVFYHLTWLPDIGHEDVPRQIEELQAAVQDAAALADDVDDGTIRYHLNGASYDVARRVDLWRAAHQVVVTSDHILSGRGLPFGDLALVNDSPSIRSAEIETVDLTGILAAVEQYEYTRLGHDGAKIAAVIEQFENSDSAERRQLAAQLDKHYRNANIRIAASGDLFNRMLPEPQVNVARVDDFLLGVPICGRSTTRTRLHARLIPDPNRVRIGMEAWGNVRADTTATSGPAEIFNQADTAFLVRKLILVDQHGVKTKRTVAEAIAENDMVGIATTYDGVPILGSLVRNVARRQADEREFEALSVTEQKVASTARRQFDQEINPRLTAAISQFRDTVWTRLVRLGLDPTVIGLSSSAKRAVSRLRVGDDNQVAAHNSRPRALSDSVISMQLHESAMNNALAQFKLDGQTLNLHDLYLKIAAKLERKVDEVPDTMPANVVIGFAPRDAIRVRCEDGMLQLTVALTKVSKGTKYNWSNLIVRANYHIELDGMQANLVRTGSIELEGKRLRTRDQIALRGVFSKLLSRSNTVQLVPDKLVSDPRLANLEVTQRVIEEGWIGIAIGPQRKTASLPAARAAEDPEAG